jgi:hypothetical protein
MDAIFFVLRTGYQWNALNATLDLLFVLGAPALGMGGGGGVRGVLARGPAGL